MASEVTATPSAKRFFLNSTAQALALYVNDKKVCSLDTGNVEKHPEPGMTGANAPKPAEGGTDVMALGDKWTVRIDTSGTDISEADASFMGDVVSLRVAWDAKVITCVGQDPDSPFADDMKRAAADPSTCAFMVVNMGTLPLVLTAEMTSGEGSDAGEQGVTAIAPSTNFTMPINSLDAHRLCWRVRSAVNQVLLEVVGSGVDLQFMVSQPASAVTGVGAAPGSSAVTPSSAAASAVAAAAGAGVPHASDAAAAAAAAMAAELVAEAETKSAGDKDAGADKA